MGDSCVSASKGSAFNLSSVNPDFIKNIWKELRDLKKPKIPVNLDAFYEHSQAFPCETPIDTCRVKSQPADRMDAIKKQIASAYPVMHEKTLQLYIKFLEHKLKFGTEKELKIYKGMTLIDFVQRLMTKRCIWFLGDEDEYCTMELEDGSAGFEAVGTENEEKGLTMNEVLSYDEIKLSALMYFSTRTEFINDGSKDNAGVKFLDKSTIEPEGVIIGLVGARFERPFVMDHQDIKITEEQNILSRGYGDHKLTTGPINLRRIWREFYEEPKDFLYDEFRGNAIDFQRFEKVNGGYFDHHVMRKRYRNTFETLLLEAQARATWARKLAYVHVLPIGLGIWKAARHQERTFFEAFEETLRGLGQRLNHIGVVHFAWFHVARVGGLYDGAFFPLDKHPRGGIKFRNSRRNGHDKLQQDMLLVVTYGGDGNALPGNEFWAGSLQGDSDSAAACSTLMAELQNPHINKDYMNGANLHIASLEHGLLHVGDYARLLGEDIKETKKEIDEGTEKKLVKKAKEEFKKEAEEEFKKEIDEETDKKPEKKPKLEFKKENEEEFKKETEEETEK